MPTLGWYINRLRGMSPAEIAWRATSAVRDCTDLVRYPIKSSYVYRAHPRTFTPGFQIAGCGTLTPCNPVWRDEVVGAANRIVNGELSIFNLENCKVGPNIDWCRDYDSGTLSPMTFSPFLDYRNHAIVGDAKFVWEPNRQQHLVVLGRAYRASGDSRFAAEVVRQVDDWIRRNPFGRGMNWRSPLELGVRLISWVWAIELIRPSGLVGDAFVQRLLKSVDLHVWEIVRKYSRGTSANNHLIGEAAGVYVASRYFGEPNGGSKRAREAREILCREIEAQSFDDGGSREHALGYQSFVMQFLFIAGLVGRWTGDEFPSVYWSRLEKMCEFAAAMTEGGENTPLFGDYDDGYVLDLGRREGDFRAWLAAAAVLFERPEFKRASGGFSECAAWLLGEGAAERFERLAVQSNRIESREFASSGYYLLQAGEAWDDERISVLFDCAELGYGAIAAHGHADALSFTLRAFGADVFVDPGTYDYFTYPEWRDYFRRTRAHNTVEIDGLDQSEITGPFMWGARAVAKCLEWSPTAEGGVVAGEHDGYQRLSDPVRHRRRLSLDGASRILTVEDEIAASDAHQVRMHLHLGETCVVRKRGPGTFEIEVGGRIVRVETDAKMNFRIERGNEEPIVGWISRGYHRRTPTATLVGACEARGDIRFVTRIAIGVETKEAGTGGKPDRLSAVPA